MPSITRRLTLVLTTAAFVAGCGGGSSPAPSGSASGTQSPAGASPATSAVAGGAGGSGPAASPAAGGSATVPSAGSGAPSAPGSSGTTGGATAPNAALELQQAFETVVRTVSPSVVVIETQSGLGSGVVFDAQGDVVTNAHVVGSDTRFRVTTAAGQRLDASLVGTFVPNDVAVIHVTGGSLQPATFGDSSALVVGEIVLAIGNPLGLQSSVTNGIVSATGRTVSEPGGAALPNVVQTSAPINPGNSGGALVDLTGAVVGIPTLTATDPEIGGVAPGIGFAIPSNAAKDFAQQMITSGKVTSSHRAYLGIRLANTESGQGVLVYSVEPGGPAAKAGIPAGVLITKVAGQPTPSADDLAAVLASLEPGRQVPVEYMGEDGTTKTVQVTLGELPG